jgi:hypothetical protein
VAPQFGLAISVALISIGFWAFLINESAARLDETSAAHVWPGRALIPIIAKPSTVVSPGPTIPVDVPVVNLATAPLPLELVAGHTMVGAYDPSGAFSSVPPRVQHWFVLQSDAKALAESLSVSDRGGAIPLVTIEPFPVQDGRTPVLENVAQGATDAELLALAQVVVDASPQVVLVRWAQEMDLVGLYPWSVDDPAAYRAAYQHVVSIFRQQGATNARWVWSPSGNSGAGPY